MTEAEPTGRLWRDSLRSPVPPRSHIWILSLIVLVGFLRGGYWVVTTEVWSRVDEAQHYGYVEWMARGHGMPVVGEDKLSSDQLGVMKASPTYGYRSTGEHIGTNGIAWLASGSQYEGGGNQGPLYYALLVPAYWLSQPFGTVATIYALRLATLLILLTAIPLLWLLARELLPRHPTVWLASPAIIVAIQGFNSNPVSITNDGLLIPVSIVALIPIASAWRGINNRQALIAGLLFGLAMLCKGTVFPLALLTLIVLLGLLLCRRASLRDLSAWGLIYAGAAVAVLSPYLAWNLLTYGSLSASAELTDILGPFLPRIPRTIVGLRTHFHNARSGLWDFQPHSLGPTSAYVRTFEIAGLVSVIVGSVVALRRRAFGEASAIAWMAMAFPLAFLVVLAGSLATYEGASTIVGRHLYAVLGLFAIATAAGVCISLGPRLGTFAVLMLIGVAFIREREIIDHNVLATYSDGVLNGRLAPVVDQPLNEGYSTDASSISATATCPVEAVGLAIGNPAPKELLLTQPSALQATYLGENMSVSIYTLPSQQSGDFTILTSGLQVGRESIDRDPTISLTGATGDPVVRLYCPVENPNEFRFKQMFYPGHLDLSYSLVRAWADVWYWIGWALVGASVAGIAVVAYGQLRVRR
jgi:hypothetical protein